MATSKNGRTVIFRLNRIRPRLLTIAASVCLSWFIVAFGGFPAVSVAGRLPDNRRYAEAGKSTIEHPSRALLVSIIRSIERYTNRERTRRGLQPLKRSAALSYLAGTQSRNMCRFGHLTHESDEFPAGWKKFDRRLKRVGLTSGGENIAYRTFAAGPDEWALLVVKGWMNSPHHKRNILDPKFRYIGVGVEPCANRIGFATQVFSSETGSVSE